MRLAERSCDGHPLFARPTAGRRVDTEPDLPATPVPDLPAAELIAAAIQMLPAGRDGSDRDCDIAYVRSVLLPHALESLRAQPF